MLASLGMSSLTQQRDEQRQLHARDDFLCRHETFIPQLMPTCARQWQCMWDTQTRNKLRELKPTLKPWPSSSRKSRQEEVTLCRLRIGHTYATHGYLLRGEDRPECPRCNEPLTVAHALLACRRYAGKRSRYLGYIPPTMSLHRLLADDSRWVQDGSIFAFIRGVDFPVIFSSYYPHKHWSYGRKVTALSSRPKAPINKQTK